MKYFVKEGERYHRLVILATHQRVEGKHQFYNLCRCDCTTTVYRTSSQLVLGLSKSCGCAHRERQKRGNFIHGGTIRANGQGSFAYLYGFWLRVRSRCHRPKDPDYPKFGGKGIALAEEWREDYPAFRDWVEKKLGPRPSPGYRLERFEREKGFAPGNLLWVTEQQAHLLRSGIPVVWV